MPNHPPKPVLRVLEKCFESEIRGMPAQFRGGSAGYKVNGISVPTAVARALTEGLIEGPVRHVMKFNDGLPPMTVIGFGLTHRGRFAYCQWASEHRGITVSGIEDDWEDCPSCGGAGVFDECVEDTCVCINPPCHWETCDVCLGEGGWLRARPPEEPGA